MILNNQLKTNNDKGNNIFKYYLYNIIILQ